jgi:hypothetical protein
MRDGAAITARLGGRRRGGSWMFRCPVHDDRNPSCSLRDDGLVTCFAGCPRQQVEAALDALGFPDTALPDQTNHGRSFPRSAPRQRGRSPPARSRGSSKT